MLLSAVLTICPLLASAAPATGVKARWANESPALTYAADSPSATMAGRPQNPTITKDFLGTIRDAISNVDRFEALL